MAQQLMGADEVRSLVGRWQSIVGQASVVDRGYGTAQGRAVRRERREERDEGFGRFRDDAPGWNPGGREGGEQRQEQRHIRREEWERLHPGEDWWEREERRKRWEREHQGVPFVGVEALMGAWYTMVGAAALDTPPIGAQPRNYLMDQAPPTFARREALPLNSGNVFATTAAPTLQITSRPQRPAFRPERLFVSIPVGGASTDTAAAWIIQDVSIGNKSQFAQSGALPGDMFANLSIDSFVSFDTVQTAMDVTITVTYVGGAGSEATIYFYGGMLGTSAVHG